MPVPQQQDPIDALRAIGNEAVTLLEDSTATDEGQVASLRADIDAADRVETVRTATHAAIAALQQTGEHTKAVATFNERLALIEVAIGDEDEAKPDAY